jgi:hypothetical protein
MRLQIVPCKTPYLCGFLFARCVGGSLLRLAGAELAAKDIEEKHDQRTNHGQGPCGNCVIVVDRPIVLHSDWHI